MRVRRSVAVVVAALLSVAGMAACGDDEDGSAAGSGDTAEAFVEVVEASIAAENDKDVSTFLDLWTDDGLESYDVGSREELESGEAQLNEQIRIVRVGEPEVTGDTARVEVDAVVGEPAFVATVYRVAMLGLIVDDEWKLNGFEFTGSPPPGEGAQVIGVTALDYAFALDPASVAAGEVALRFSNEGEEPHEITIFRAPQAITLEDAKANLAEVDGSELTGAPAGYEVAHIAFAEPGEAHDVTFADAMEAGTYVLACYIPQGGFGEDEESAPDPATPSHFDLGMVSVLTVG